MSREIEKGAFLVVDNMQSVYSSIFMLTKAKQVVNQGDKK